MKRLITTWAILGIIGCAKSSDDTSEDDDTNGACGAVSEHDVDVLGVVHDLEAEPVEGVNVQLEDRGWSPGTILGTAVTSVSGQFEISGATITDVEDCWGTLLDYVLVASDGSRTGEKAINTQLFNTIADGESVANVEAIPIVLE